MVTGKGERTVGLYLAVVINGADLDEAGLLAHLEREAQYPAFSVASAKVSVVGRTMALSEPEGLKRTAMELARKSAWELLDATKDSKALRGERHSVTIAHDAIAKWLADPDSITPEMYSVARAVLLSVTDSEPVR